MAVNATAVWRARPSGSNTNGGGFDTGISGYGTDYSQQNTAIYAPSGTLSTSAANSATLLDSGNGFTPGMVGNAINITGGTNFTAGIYFITVYNGAGSVTLDHTPTPSAAGSAGSGNVGGGWADFWHNTDTSGNFASASAVVPGNIVYILGSGVPNPASYTYDYVATNYFHPAAGTTSAGPIRFIGDPATPGGGVPCIQLTGSGLLFWNSGGWIWQNLWFVGAGNDGYGQGVLASTDGNPQSETRNVVFDQFGYDLGLTGSDTTSDIRHFGLEIFSSVSKRSTNTKPALFLATQAQCIGGNIHDCIGPAIVMGETGAACHTRVTKTIIAKNGGTAILTATQGVSDTIVIENNTIDRNAGNGIEFSTQQDLADAVAFNNIISNHTTASTYGMTVDAGTAAVNNLIKGFVDYNTFYNNTTDVNAISYGAHDTSNSGSAPNTISASPYVNSATENYALA